MVYSALCILTATKNFHNYEDLLRLLTFSLLSALYLGVIILLNRKMLELGGDFKTERKSINLQFTIFLISYVTRLVWYIALDTMKQKLLNFGGACFLSLAQIVWNIAPVFYSLLSHHLVFKQIQLRKMTMDSTTEPLSERVAPIARKTSSIED